jgi:hypothetical protein
VKPLLVSLNTLEIHHLKNVLEAEGIRCFLRNELLARLAGEIPFTECALELYLRDEADRWRAERILDDWRRSRPMAGKPWTCPGCGERLEGQFTSCWQCGRTRSP